ncbi:Uncharacterised protein [Enterobacter cloacae]|nr:Uncharacterised protein [Enterobacter cloacae]
MQILRGGSNSQAIFSDLRLGSRIQLSLCHGGCHTIFTVMTVCTVATVSSRNALCASITLITFHTCRASIAFFTLRASYTGIPFIALCASRAGIPFITLCASRTGIPFITFRSICTVDGSRCIFESSKAAILNIIDVLKVDNGCAVSRHTL